MGIYEELEWRGLIKDVSDPSLREKLNAGGMTFYIGTDPTGDSLHIGHFSSFLISKRLKDAGHHPILLVGGGTGLIGDPKPDAERPMITYEEVSHNFECLKKQAETIYEKTVDQFMPIFLRHGIKKPIIVIRKMKTLWGSCSKHLNKITLNEYLLKADIRGIEYVVFHELTHLIYNAHNKNFYDFLTIYMPDWKERKKRQSIISLL